jgi:hypothetical protein
MRIKLSLKCLNKVLVKVISTQLSKNISKFLPLCDHNTSKANIKCIKIIFLIILFIQLNKKRLQNDNLKFIRTQFVLSVHSNQILTLKYSIQYKRCKSCLTKKGEGKDKMSSVERSN